MAIGFRDSGIKVWSLVPQKLRLMKTGEELQDIDREAGNIIETKIIPIETFSPILFQDNYFNRYLKM